VEQAKGDVAIVALAIGEPYFSNWQKYSAPSWQAYAKKHGYDIIVLTEPLDRSPLAAARSPAWQKCLVPCLEGVARYRQVVLLDCDIVINDDTAPRITDQVPVEYVGGVLSGAPIQEDLRIVLLCRMMRRYYEYEPGTRHWQEFQNEAHRPYGLAPTGGRLLQTGVLVASPAHHRAIFEGVYHARYSYTSRCHEQVPLSHELLSRGLFSPIDTRFNSVFHESMVVHYPYLLNKSTTGYDLLAKHATRVALANNFFLHFAYDAELMRYLFD
jgi:hypothetical protein